ncbi:unnamed protein product [Scytosiphon promiscuus]
MGYAIEEFRRKLEDGGALLQSYIFSVKLRDDTKLSLLLGVLAGLAVVTALVAYPGKPIDYSGVGIDLPAEMRGGGKDEGASVKPTTGDGSESAGTSSPKKAAGLQQIQGVVENMSELRRRKRAKRTIGADVDEKTLVDRGSHNDELADSGRPRGKGEWDTSRLDADKLAEKIGSSKAARMLGLTEDQVRQAVLDAKQELQQQSHPQSGGPNGPDTSDDGIGFSGLLSSAMLLAGLGALWVYLSAHPYGTLSRFLLGVFPREMETLGLAP